MKIAANDRLEGASMPTTHEQTTTDTPTTYADASTQRVTASFVAQETPCVLTLAKSHALHPCGS